MPTCTRPPSRTMVCRQRPPPPGCHLRACSWLEMPGESSHVSPPSLLEKSDAGSTPAQIAPSGPASSDQLLAIARPSSLGNAGADFVSTNVLPRSLDLRTFIPKNGLQLPA